MPNKRTYTPMPEVAPELAARYEVVLEVLSGALTVSEGARRLHLSRNHFQTLMHRALAKMLEGLGPKPGGRPPTPSRERELRDELNRLRQENGRLQQRLETTDRVLNVASGLLRGRAVRGKIREPGGPGAKDSSPEGG